MRFILKEFLKDSENKTLFHLAKDKGNKDAQEMLNKKFNDFVFEICFISYVEKTLRLTAKEFYRKNRIIQSREMYILNVTNTETGTEMIEAIPDNTDIVEEVANAEETENLMKNFIDTGLIEAMRKLKTKQKLVIYKMFIEEKTRQQIAKELGISLQAVSKIKKKKHLAHLENG